MTKIKLEKKGRAYRVKLDGHAKGSEAVCAGLSAIACTLIGYLDHVNAKIIRFDEWDGYLDITFKGRRARVIFDMISCGLYLMARDYPEYCRIE